ncbi:LOW QUALITY PROTEIN: BPI fold-containing family A member 1-like, partial [Equus quagga]|uniref:LOW QUALITY PROTEIN: BPI fold-containing family A member 1-like n=1 Tax=Equus quagga TaxID=89248 RepID=UPI001EE34E81
MLLFWGSLLCWGLLPQAQGQARHLLFLRVSKDQLETDISDLFSEQRILDRVTRIPVTEAADEGVPILDHLPFVREGLSRKSSRLDLSLVGDLLSGKSLPLLEELFQAGGLIIEDAKGPEVTLQILSDSLFQVTLQTKLYLSLQRILRFSVIKNIRIGVRLEQTGNKTRVAFDDCHTPPGNLSIEVLEKMNPFLVNEALKVMTGVLDKTLPFFLQKMVCPLATTLLNSLLEDVLRITLAPTISGPEDFQYHVTTTELTEEAILMQVQLVTSCGPGQRAPRPDHLAPQPLPKLAQGSMADLAFWLEEYNDILSCLYTSKEL